MVKIYHNPRCSKSRAGKQFLEEKNIEFEEILYMKDELSAKELKSILKNLGIKPKELIRQNEKIWKEKFKDKTLTDNELIDAMMANPQLIERPIVMNGEKAVVARPTEKIDEIF